MKFCGEIQYETPEGNVHSDICFRCGPNHDSSHHLLDEGKMSHREFLHMALDEWLNKSEGTGAFWVGDPEYFKSWE